MTRARHLTAVLSVTAVVALTAAPAHPATTEPGSAERATEVEVRPRALPRGPAPAIAWLASNVVHTPNGRTHTLPWTARAAVNHDLTLRGRSPAGWVVTDFDGGQYWRAWVVDGDTRRKIDLGSVNNDERSWVVARDGSALLKREFTQDFASLRVTRLEDGTLVEDRDFDGSGQVLDFTGPEAVVTVDGDTLIWEPGGGTTPVGAQAVAADLEHDVLVVPGSTPDTVGPTSLADPGPPAWTAPLTRVEVSPDGRYLLGRVTGLDTEQRHLEIRRISDGEVVASFHVRNLSRTVLQWETPTSIVFAVSRTGLGDVNALAHCGLDGTCTRATAWRQLRLFSLVRAPQLPG